MRHFTYQPQYDNEKRPKGFKHNGGYIITNASMGKTLERGEPQVINTTNGMLINGLDDIHAGVVSPNLSVQAVFPFLEAPSLMSDFGLRIQFDEQQYVMQGQDGRWFCYHITEENKLLFTCLNYGSHFGSMSLDDGNMPVPWIIYQTMTMDLTTTVSLEAYIKNSEVRKYLHEEASADGLERAIKAQKHDGDIGIVTYADRSHIWVNSQKGLRILQPQVEKELVEVWFDIPEQKKLSFPSEEYSEEYSNADIIETQDARSRDAILAALIDSVDPAFRQPIIIADLLFDKNNIPLWDRHWRLDQAFTLPPQSFFRLLKTYAQGRVSSFSSGLIDYVENRDDKVGIILPAYLAYRMLNEKKATRWLRYFLSTLGAENRPDVNWLAAASQDDVFHIAKALQNLSSEGDYGWFAACCTQYVATKKPTLAYLDALQQACPAVLDKQWQQACKDFIAIEPRELEKALQELVPKSDSVDWVLEQITSQITSKNTAKRDQLSAWLAGLEKQSLKGEVVTKIYQQWVTPEQGKKALRRLYQGLCIKATFVLMIVLVVHYVFGLGTLAYIAINIMLDIMNGLFSAHLALLPSLVGSPIVSLLLNTFLIMCCFAFFMELHIPRSNVVKQGETPLNLIEKSFLEEKRQSSWALLMNLFNYDATFTASTKEMVGSADIARGNGDEQEVKVQPKASTNSLCSCFFGGSKPR